MMEAGQRNSACLSEKARTSPEAGGPISWRRILSQLSGRWRHLLSGYLFAFVGEMTALAVSFTLSYVHLIASFPSILMLLVVVFAALLWGAGPGSFATFLGTVCMLVLLVSPSYLASSHPINLVNVLLFLSTGMVINFFVLRRNRAAQAAKKLAAERDLEHTQLEAMFESIADGVVVNNAQGQVVRMNGTYRKLCGLDKQPGYLSQSMHARGRQMAMHDHQGRPLPPEQWPLNRLLNGEVITGANAIDITASMLDGHEREVSVSGAPILNQHGEITGAIAIIRDVTERRRLERRTQTFLDALLAMAELLVSDVCIKENRDIPPQMTTRAVVQSFLNMAHNLFDCQCIHVVTLEPGTNIVRPLAFIDATSQQDHGCWSTLPEKPLIDYVRDAELYARLHVDRVIPLHMSQVPSDVKLRELIPFSALVIPMRLYGQLVGLLNLCYEDTLQTLTEKEVALAEAVGRLIALVIERERLLQEREEARAHEMALAETQRRMDAFLSMATHELRTPLTVLALSSRAAQRMLSDALSTEENRKEKLGVAQRFCERIEQHTSSLNRLVGDLLQASRLQVGKLEYQMVPCDLVTIVREVVEEQRHLSAEHCIQLTLPAGDESLTVIADVLRIGQVLTNYLTNALKYTAVELPVEVSLQREQTAYARVIVRDKGPGLTAEERQHLWERFYQVERVKEFSGVKDGLGLGLSISRAIIEQHDGQVGVESKLDEGSTFWFTLPLVQEQETSTI